MDRNVFNFIVKLGGMKYVTHIICAYNPNEWEVLKLEQNNRTQGKQESLWWTYLMDVMNLCYKLTCDQPILESFASMSVLHSLWVIKT